MGSLKLSFYFFISLLISSFIYASSLENGENVQVAGLTVNDEQTDSLSNGVSFEDNTDQISLINGKGHEKSFKASCANGLGVNGGAGYTCTFSMVTRVETVTTNTVYVIIYINGTPGTSKYIQLASTNTEYILNFDVHPDDNVLIYFNPGSLEDTFYYNVYNAANQAGYVSTSTPLNGNIILSSKSTTFQIYNSCSGPGSCPLNIVDTGSTADWASSGVTVKIYVNNILVGTFNGINLLINVYTGDTIVYEVIGTTIPYGLQMTSNLVGDYSYWNSNLFFSPAIIPNGCSALKSPFGGSVFKLTSNQVNLFLSENTIPTTRIVSFTVPSFTNNKNRILGL